MNKNSKIFIAGHRGLVGSAIVKTLQSQGFNNLVLRARDELDLMNQSAVLSFFENKKPEYVFLAAAKVGGIFANNTFPAEFIYNNLTIQNNIIHASYLSGVKRLLFLGSSCIYPRECPQPMKEEHLLTGPLEATNRPYAVAKIAGIEMCWSYNRQYNTKYFAVMPTNLFGPNDNFDLKNSHVIPALIRKCHEAKTQGFESVEVWGTGRSRREFLYSEDMAEACVYFMNLSDRELEPVVDPNNCPLINVGVGEDIGIADLAQEVQKTVGRRLFRVQ
jgi:GDP-L-fucose synthase